MSTPGSKGRTAIAVVGIGAMFPGRGTTAGFWRDIVEATDASSEVPATHWLIDDFYDPDPSKPDKTYCRRGAFIPAFPFDPVEFGTPPAVVETTDTVQLIALYVAKQVLAQATRTRFQQIDPERTSVVLGVAAGTELIGDMASRLNRPVWIKAMREGGLSAEAAGAIADRIGGSYTEWRESTFPGMLGNVVAGRITNRLDLGGVNFTADAACASGLAAVRYAVHELVLGESDMVLAGGADALNNVFMYMCFSKTPAMSAAGVCRPFSDSADGTLVGEGCGIFALRRLEDAERDGNDIYAVIRGVGASSDGRAKSVYAPRPGGQALALRRAYEAADYSPATVELVEAHGTGTRAGDAAEFEALRQVFAAADPAGRQWCALGSVKSQIGHTKSAAGAAGMVKAVLALHHRVLPPTINVTRPNPALKIADSPFYLNAATRPWVRAGDQPRRAAVSSFGFGGSNFHVTLEEYRGPGSRPPRLRVQSSELFLFSASSRDSLAGKAKACLATIRSDADLGHHARQAQAGFNRADACRVAVVAGSIAELEERLAKALPRVDQQPFFALPDIAMASGKAEPGKIAFLFAGQGSQYPGMGGDLAIAFEAVRQVWDEAATLTPVGVAPPHAVTFPVPAFDDVAREAQANRLMATENAQPAIATVALSQLALLALLGLKPDLVAGHSFGEVMALHAAGAFTKSTALRIARARGEAMAAAVAGSEGAMLAVTASRQIVEAKLAALPPGIVIANDNGPLQVILSGPKAAIEEAERRLPGLGLSVKRVRVSSAFHSPMVASAAVAFGRSLRETELATPSLPVYANATAERYPAAVDAARDLLSQQLARAVRFTDMIEALYRDGARTFVEIGPGAVLTALVGQILGDRRHVAVSIDDRKRHGVAAFHSALGRLAVAGIPLALDALWTEAPPVQPLPAPKKHVIMLNGANYAKPYPPRAGAVPPPVAAPAIAETKADIDRLPRRRPRRTSRQ